MYCLGCPPFPLQAVKVTDEQTGKSRYPVKAINILKAHGKSALDSTLIKGYAINMARAAQVEGEGLLGCLPEE